MKNVSELARMTDERRALAVDAAAAVVLYGLLVVSRWAFVDTAARGLGWEMLAAGALLALPLAARRRAPLTVLAAVGLGYAAYVLVERDQALAGSLIPVLLGLYGAGVYGRPVARDIVRAVVSVAIAALILWVFGTALYVVLFAGVWILGEQTRRGRQRQRELAARTKELEVARQRSAQQAATEERLRIARELHDVLGHHVSVMGVQAAGANRVLGTDPDRARDALQAIERSSRQAVTEMQRVLALLRVDDERPRPELGRLDELVAEIRDAGVDVSVQVHPPPDLPASLDLAATRVVQEALTNVLRHAGPGASAAVRVAEADGMLEVVVEDDGQGAGGAAMAAHVRGGGRGLVGLRERVELHGGEFRAGPRSPAGFRVVATLPLRGT